MGHRGVHECTEGAEGLWDEGGGRERAGEAGQVHVCGKFSTTPHQGELGSRWPLFGGSSLLCVKILPAKPTLHSEVGFFLFFIYI